MVADTVVTVDFVDTAYAELFELWMVPLVDKSCNTTNTVTVVTAVAVPEILSRFVRRMMILKVC